MRTDEWLAGAAKRLSAHDIDSARLDCLLLLEDVTSRDRAWLLAHLEHQLSDDDIRVLNNNIVQRESHIPLSYIRGHSEFYGRTFHVDQRTLVPRPETETMLSMLLKSEIVEHPIIVDAGTGSGALAITAKLEMPHATVYGTDIDLGCLEVARGNATALQSNVLFVEADLLLVQAGALPKPDIILANLPYVPDQHPINQAATHEPRVAIFGGADGLVYYRQMFEQIKSCDFTPTLILTESLRPQHDDLTKIAAAAGYRLQQRQDLILGFIRGELRRA